MVMGPLHNRRVVGPSMAFLGVRGGFRNDRKPEGSVQS